MGFNLDKENERQRSILERAPVFIYLVCKCLVEGFFFIFQRNHFVCLHRFSSLTLVFLVTI